MTKPRALLLPLFGLIGACGGAYAEFAPTREIVPRAPIAPDAVAVYLREPGCPYTELGLLEAHDGTFPSSLTDKFWALRKRAGHHGANGVLVIDHQDSVRGTHGGGTDHHYTALAIVVDPCVPVAGRAPASEPAR